MDLKDKSEESFAKIVRVYSKQGDFDSAISYCEKMMENKMIVQDEIAISRIYNLMGEVYIQKRDFDKALEYRQKCLDIRKKNNDQIAVAEAYNDIGVIYYKMKQYQRAIEYYKEANKILSSARNVKEWYAINNHNIGTALYQMGKAKESEKYFLNCLDIYKELKLKTQISEVFYFLGVLYFVLNDITKSLNYIKQCYHLFEEEDNKKMMAYSEKVLGDIYLEFNKHKEALKLYNKCEKYFAKNDPVEYSDLKQRISRLSN